MAAAAAGAAGSHELREAALRKATLSTVSTDSVSKQSAANAKKRETATRSSVADAESSGEDTDTAVWNEFAMPTYDPFEDWCEMVLQFG